MSNSVRVFVSSTWQDLQAEREAVEKVLHRMRDADFAGMEYFGSRPETPRDVSLAEVDLSDIYVGIFAYRYGSGITEDEYRRARQRKIPCLVYMKDETVPISPPHIERDPVKVKKLEALKDELKRNHTVSVFKTPDDLATKVVADLHNQLRSAPGSESVDSAQAGPKYQISIGNAQGVVIGDGTQVTQYFGSESKATSPRAAAAVSRQRRCEYLAESIKETLQLISRYEDERRLADDPKAEQYVGHEITKLRRRLQEYETDRKTLGCE